jgi:hypothetical protein
MVKIINQVGWGLAFTFSSIVLMFNIRLRNQFKQVVTEIDTAINNNYKIGQQLIHGVILIEDKRFYSHRGIDLYAICRAIKNYSIAGKLEGASTIEQQLVRLITNEREISISRKIKELIYAVRICNMYRKNEVALTYLNIYQFYNEIKGVSGLCYSEQYDFCNLNLKSVCEIAARIKYPSITKRNYLPYLKRVRKIEILLSKNDFGMVGDAEKSSGKSVENGTGFLSEPIKS